MPLQPAVCCDLVGHAAVRATQEAIAALRRAPGPGPGERLPVSFLKHADEQSVVALAAVLRAVAEHGLGSIPFGDWGILAAPRFIGRVALAGAIHRYAAEGAWGISPHLIPHRSLHAISGTISQALKIHGPNFGVGGGPHAAGEVMLAAAALLGTRPLPGLWVVLTGWDPEPIPDRDGKTATACLCGGVALGLTPARADWRGLRLRITLPRRGELREPGGTDPAGSLSLERLLAGLGTEDPAPAAWPLAGGGRLELERAGACAGLPVPHLFRQFNGVHVPGARSGIGPGREP
jgi:hypothetical protein